MSKSIIEITLLVLFAVRGIIMIAYLPQNRQITGRGGKLSVPRLCLRMSGMILAADKTDGMAVVLFTCQCCSISNATS